MGLDGKTIMCPYSNIARGVGETPRLFTFQPATSKLRPRRSHRLDAKVNRWAELVIATAESGGRGKHHG